MSNITNKISFSERQYMQKIFEFIDSMIIKSDFDAEEYETLESKRAGERYVLASQKRDSLFDYYGMLGVDVVKSAGIDERKAGLFETNKEAFFNSLTKDETDTLLTFLRKWRIKHYEEKNPYYLILNGHPTSDDQIIEVVDQFENNEKVKLHDLSITYHTSLYQYYMNDNCKNLNKLISQLEKAGRHYDYLGHLANKVDYATARAAKNFQILKYDGGILNHTDMHRFFTEYARAADYVQSVPYIQAYGKTEELYDRFMVVTVIFIALENFLSLKIDSMARHKFSTREDRILFFKDYDMESIVKNLSDSQMDALIENMDHLIPLKGSEEVISKVLDLFGISNIDVYKYLLFKTIKSDPLTKDIILDPSKPRSENYDVEMVRIPVNTKDDAKTIAHYLQDESARVNPKSVMLNDPHFGYTDSKDVYYEQVMEKLKNSEEFTYFYTKYLGIISHIQITQALIRATYLFQQLFHDSKSLDIKCKTSVPQDVTCRDLIAAINLIVTLRSNMSDDIMTDVSATARIMGFNTNPNLEELKEMESCIFQTGKTNTEVVTVKLKDMIDESEIFVVQSSDSYGSTIQPNNPANRNKARCTVNYEFNIKKYLELSEKIENSKDYTEYTALQQIFEYNMHTLSALEMFRGYKKYSEYLKVKTPKLYDYIYDSLNNATSSIWDSPDGETRTKEFINKCIDLTSQFVEAILKAIGADHTTSDSAMNTYVDSNSAFSRIFTVINFFKSYTTQFANTDSVYTINNPLNCIVRIFHKINAITIYDYHRESLAELVFHSLNESGTQSDLDKIELREWLAQYTSEDVAQKIETSDDLHVDGSIGYHIDDAVVHHSYWDRVRMMGIQKILVKDYMDAGTGGGGEKSEISVSDGGLFGKYRYSDSRELERYEPDTPSDMHQSILLFHEPAPNGITNGSSGVELNHVLERNGADGGTISNNVQVIHEPHQYRQLEGTTDMKVDDKLEVSRTGKPAHYDTSVGVSHKYKIPKAKVSGLTGLTVNHKLRREGKPIEETTEIKVEHKIQISPMAPEMHGIELKHRLVEKQRKFDAEKHLLNLKHELQSKNRFAGSSQIGIKHELVEN